MPMVEVLFSHPQIKGPAKAMRHPIENLGNHSIQSAHLEFLLY